MRFVKYRRKREGKTDYRKRLRLLVSGSNRMVIRKTNKHIILQIIEYFEDGDKVLVTVNSSELKKYGWNKATGNIPASYLTGLILAKKALRKSIDSAIVDIGLQTPTKGSRLFAAVKGAIDGGMKISCSDDAFPSIERINGTHISKEMSLLFEKTKNNILKSV